MHEKKETVSCHICSVTFTVPASLRVHIRTVHEKKKPCLCNICGKNLPTNASLKNHILGVHEKIPKKKRKHMLKTIKIEHGVYSGGHSKLTE